MQAGVAEGKKGVAACCAVGSRGGGAGHLETWTGVQNLEEVALNFLTPHIVLVLINLNGILKLMPLVLLRGI
eukprot:scaffold185551_cov16-Tisochrysis_lutea.AAC.1